MSTNLFGKCLKSFSKNIINQTNNQNICDNQFMTSVLHCKKGNMRKIIFGNDHLKCIRCGSHLCDPSFDYHFDRIPQSLSLPPSQSQLVGFSPFGWRIVRPPIVIILSTPPKPPITIRAVTHDAEKVPVFPPQSNFSIYVGILHMKKQRPISILICA